MQCPEFPFHKKSVLVVNLKHCCGFSRSLWGEELPQVRRAFQMIIHFLSLFSAGKPGAPCQSHGGTNDRSGAEAEAGQKASPGESESAQRTGQPPLSPLPVLQSSFLGV